MLAVQADRFSSHPAIPTPDGFSMTYAELRAAVDRLRRRLHTLGVSRDQRIAVVFPNGSGMAVASLACASTAACAPINPAYRQPEFGYYFADPGVKALLTSRGASANAVLAAQARDIPVFLLDTSFSIDGRQSADAASGGPPVPEDTALVLHTSGATSRPKQVPLRSSSAPLPPRLMHGIENLFGVPMIEAYGMTEAAGKIQRIGLAERLGLDPL